MPCEPFGYAPVFFGLRVYCPQLNPPTLLRLTIANSIITHLLKICCKQKYRIGYTLPFSSPKNHRSEAISTTLYNTTRPKTLYKPK